MMKPTYAWVLASHWHITKKTTSSAILRSAQPITSALSTSSPPTPSHSVLQPDSTALELNDKLVNLAKLARYDEAYRLCNYLFENKIHVKHHLVYEKAALAGVNLGRTDEGLKKFILWLSLVPDPDELPPSLTSKRRFVYSDTRFSLIRCGNPKVSLKYIMAFGNIMAAKGYIQACFVDVARVVVRFAKKEVVVHYFEELEAAIAYHWEQEPEAGGRVLTWFWEVIVKFYMEKGWLGPAFHVVVEKDGKLELSDELRKGLLKKLEASGDAKRVPVLRALLDRSAAKEVTLKIRPIVPSPCEYDNILG